MSTIRCHWCGASMGKDTNWMPMPSSTVVSHRFSMAAPMLNTE